MKNALLILIILTNTKLFLGQSNIGNYVNNGSFEALNSSSVSSYYHCVEYWRATDTTKYALYLATELAPITNIPYQHGYQFARTGKNYVISTITYYNYFPISRGYPCNRLKKALKANTVYCVKFYVNSPNIIAQSTDSYGVYFGDSNLDTIKYCTIPLTYINPQVQNQQGNFISDTLRWIPVTGTFVATGTEKYMLLGNFRSNANTSTIVTNTSTMAVMDGIDVGYDDVSVIEKNLPAYAGRDTIVTPGSPVFIGREPDFATDSGCVWYKWPNMTVPIATVSGMWVNPTTTSTYIVRQTLDCSPEKWDTVVVIADLVGLQKLRLNNSFKLFPIPAEDYVEFVIVHSDQKISNWKIYLYNNIGQLVKEEEVSFTNKKVRIDISNVSVGAYLIKLTDSKGESLTEKLMISR